MKDQEIIKIQFKGRYIQGEALDVLFNFDDNKYIAKTSPGIGLTTSLLDYTGGNMIIVCPLTPMIEKKAQGKNSYKSKSQFFNCNSLDSNWETVQKYFLNEEEHEQNLIINCTPDAICYVKDCLPELYEKLKSIPIVVDEYDTLVMQSNFRERCGRFIELMINEWTASYTLTTATPNHNNIDVPINASIKFYEIGPENKELRHMQYSTRYSDLMDYTISELQKGNKVAIFTNNIHIHKKEFSEYQKSMVGKTLQLRLEYFDVKTQTLVKEEDFEEANVSIFSTKFFVGYDINKNVSLVILSEATNQSRMVGINQLVQATFRCRKKIKNILFINSKLSENITPNQDSIENAIKNYHLQVESCNLRRKNYRFSWEIGEDEPITQELYVNRSKIVSNTLFKIYKYELHMPELLSRRLDYYGFKLSDYIPSGISHKPPSSTKFNERIKNVMKDDIRDIEEKYETVKNDLKFFNQGVHNPDRVMERLTGLILKKAGNEDLISKLNNKNLKPTRFYEAIDKFLQKNYSLEYLTDHYLRSSNSLSQIVQIPTEEKNTINQEYLNHWYLFYAAYKVKKEQFPTAIYRHYFIRKIAGKYANIEVFENLPNKRVEAAFNKLKSTIEKEIGNLEEFEKEKLLEIIDNQFNSDEKSDIPGYSKKAVINKIRDVLFYFINPEININTKDFREYNPLTFLDRAYRPLIPIDYVVLDIKSANTQFVDKLIDTNMQSKVYENIMKTRGVNRSTAKRSFNKILNNHRISYDLAFQFYFEYCEYDEPDARQLAKFTTSAKQKEVFKKMNEYEMETIECLRNHFDSSTFRLHDALIVPPWDISQPLPTLVNHIHLEASYFISKRRYDGELNKDNIELPLIKL